MRFVQFYFGLPIAMVILGVTLVPFLHRAHVYTAYEYLERRFDARTRALTAFLFLVSRGMSCGTIIAAPAVVFSAIFGWPIGVSCAVIGLPAVAYTMIGGVPRYLYRVALRELVAMGRALFQGRPVERFEHELWLWMFGGIVRQRWRDRRTPFAWTSRRSSATARGVTADALTERKMGA
jgi:hypothetical protein